MAKAQKGIESREIPLSYDLANGTANLGEFLRVAHLRGYHHIAKASWVRERVETGMIEADPDATFPLVLTSLLVAHNGYREFLLEYEEPGWIVWMVQEPDGQVINTVAAQSEQLALECIEMLRRQMPERKVTQDMVQVSFWSLGPMGPDNQPRFLQVAPWSDIADNYPRATALELDMLMAARTAPQGGQLILWHGVPGTGKTWALRALASEWREWCDLYYITDPETFFGDRANYMVRVLLGGEDAKRWRLLVLEDAGELVMADAKERMGQGLSRLLNVTDGLIGQGLRVLVLVTTNESVRSLNPAIARTGRCMAEVEFGSFGVDEANDWFARRDIDLDGAVRPLQTIAEMYARLQGRDASKHERVKVGFQR